MKYSLQILKKKNFSQETQTSFPKCTEHQTFLDTWGFSVITKLSNPWLQENGMPEKSLDAPLSLCQHPKFCIISTQTHQLQLKKTEFW